MAAAITLTMRAAITLTMAAAIIYDSDHYPNHGSGRYLWQRPLASRNFDLVSLVHFGRSGGRDHNAPCFGTISWKERTLNDGSGHYPNDGSGYYLWLYLFILWYPSVGRAGQNASCLGTISWKERTLNDGRCDSPVETHPKDQGSHCLWQRSLPSR